MAWIIRCVISIPLLLIMTLSHAQTLTPSLIDRWISTMQQFQDQEVIQEDMDEGSDFEGGLDDVMAQLAVEIKKSSTAMAVIQKQGFSSANEWADVSTQIYRTFAAIHIDDDGAALAVNEQMQQALRELDSNPHLTADQKAQMRQQMAAAGKTMASFTDNVSSADKAAVKARLQQLEQLFEE